MNDTKQSEWSIYGVVYTLRSCEKELVLFSNTLVSAQSELGLS